VIAVPRRSALPQILLLVLTALGVAGMHTMGHVGAGHGTHAVQAVQHAMHTVQAVHAGPHTATAPAATSMIAAVPPVALARIAVPHRGGDLDPTQMCLAVLTLVGSALLIAAALLAIGRPARSGTALRTVFAASGRDPPPRRPPVGLLVAELSVLRT
jgi:hypothetical protein